MTIAELKEAIAELSDDMEICVEISLPNDNPIDGLTTFDITMSPFNNWLYINALFHD